nr:PREDICTED: facilitated trehalose transporter Tret1-like [Bemisia tabaci]
MLTLTLGIRRQLAAAFACSLASLIAGCVLGWPSPTLKKLREPDSPLHLSTYQEAWVVNALYYGTVLSPFPSGYLMNKLGRKMSLLVLCVFPTLSWILIYFSSSAYMLMLARLFAGFWTGGTQTVMPIYIAEISEPQVRGVFGTFIQLNIYLGTNFAFLVGPYVSIQLMAILCGILPVIFFVLFGLCPESPYFYTMEGRHAAAADALTWLRGDAPVDAELRTVRHSVEKESANQSGVFRRIADLVTVPANRKAFIIVETMNALQRFSGISCMMAFSSVVLPETGALNSDHCTIIMGIVWMVSCLGTSGLIDKAGRKPLLYVSSIGIGVSMLWTGVWYYLDENTTYDVTGWNWLPLAGFLAYGCTFSLGLGPLSSTYQGEMFPSNLKGQASAITTITTALASAISTGLFAVLSKNVGVYMNFYIFSAVGFINFFFTYFYVIETKGKSLQMIQAELNGEEIIKPEMNGDSEKV